ncbi:MAG: cupin domain-containing protein [Rhodobacteraceae bacterium]|nr:cupin domain-containing protein [Paracoccaceae bacterium]MCY4196995.1 cupin domain-containing protein [Paracoccaceae bacterium]
MISNGDMAARIVRYGELIPCRTAFIDTYNPGSDRKENFTIVGGGVSENPDQHVHICDTPGFNIGAAGQPPNCRNSLHSHHTAEVFIVLKGRWRFFWGRWGKAGEVVLEDGDIFNIPTGIFRGFENIGQCHGMLFAVLGGDDAGGGVVWAPQVIEEGRKNGMILSASGKLYDRNRGEELPAGEVPMPTLSDAELSAFPEIPVGQVVPRFVARRWDMKALSANAPAPVIGDNALIVDRPGFTVDFLSCGATTNEMTASEKHEVLLVTEGHWKLTWQGEDTVLAPGDTCAVPPDTPFNIAPAVSGENGMFRVRGTDDPAGPTWNF